MSVSRFPQITEELLSAYLDNNVSDEERRLIEHAVSVDQQVAWQLESLRQTVQLLNTLPAIALPRAFTLDRVLLEEKLAAEQAKIAKQRVVQSAPVGDNWWQRLLQGWQSGNPYLRNGAAVAILLLVVLVAGNQLFTSQPFDPRNRAAPESAAPAEVALAITAAPLVQEAPALSEEGVAAESQVTEAPATEVAIQQPTNVATDAPNSSSSNTSDAPAQPQAFAATQAGAPTGSADISTFRGPAALPQGTGGGREDEQPLNPSGPMDGGAPPNQGMGGTQTESLATGTLPPETAAKTNSNRTTAPVEAAASVAAVEESAADEVVVAAAANTETLTIMATPMLTPTLTPTSTATITPTATVTVTLTPTVTQISQGGNLPPVQIMAVLRVGQATAGDLLAQLSVMAVVTTTLVGWRGRRKAHPTNAKGSSHA